MNQNEIIMAESDLLNSSSGEESTGLAATDDIGKLLSEINACSVELEKAEKQRSEQRKLLQALATASEVMLTVEGARSLFDVNCFVHWKVFDDQKTLQITVKNKSNFSLSPQYWCFTAIVNVPSEDGEDNDGEKHVKSQPILEDLPPEGSCSVFIPLQLRLTPSNWQLPIDVTVHLQFYVPAAFVPSDHRNIKTSESGCSENSLCVVCLELAKFTVDEFYFFDLKDKIVSAKQLSPPSKVEEFLQSNNPKPSETSDSLKIAISTEVAQRIRLKYKGSNIFEGIQTLICCCSRLKPLEDPCQFTVSCTGHSVTFSLIENTNFIISIKSHYLLVAARIRAGILRRLKEFLTTEAIASTCSVESVTIGKGCIAQAQRFVLASNPVELQRTSEDPEVAAACYQKIRNDVSTQFPLV